jgi:hypothetical protein
MFLLDGKRLTPGSAFTHGDIQYPANWLYLASLEEKEAIGITEVSEDTRPNDRFYWVTDNNDGTFTSSPKELNDSTDKETHVVIKGLKSNWITTIKTTANSLLAKTDWMVVRKFERDIDIPTDTATYRAAVITETNRLETAITATTTVEELVTVISAQNWPQE